MLWVTARHHIISSKGFAFQSLDYTMWGKGSKEPGDEVVVSPRVGELIFEVVEEVSVTGGAT
jgi:hypothetical protein